LAGISAGGNRTGENRPRRHGIPPLDFVHYPFSHSLVAVVIWGVLFGLVHYILRRNVKHALLLGPLVFSHWLLDAIVHRPDLPITPWTDIRIGMSLWNSVIFESALFVGGTVLYARATRRKTTSIRWGFWALIGFLAVVYVMNLAGTPPDAVEPIAIVGLSQWLIVGWAYWMDRKHC
jgi:membrane-bound metal-dependent hydrolase YbcI (DUF457 family)